MYDVSFQFDAWDRRTQADYEPEPELVHLPDGVTADELFGLPCAAVNIVCRAIAGNLANWPLDALGGLLLDYVHQPRAERLLSLIVNQREAARALGVNLASEHTCWLTMALFPLHIRLQTADQATTQVVAHLAQFQAVAA
jgi:hypothetical protein